jgi:endonuclease III-like uncharacterized protein
MIKNSKPAFIAIISTILLFSCQKKISKKDIEENLKAAMSLSLNHRPGIDTSRVKFYVREVAYFEDKSAYLCQFKVDMKEKTNEQIKDTTGIMNADISKDFKTVSRRN